MNLVKGFRFHPTDEELIEYLHIKTFDHDSLFEVIAEIQDICELEPWELPGCSNLQTGDRSWYFMYPPKYKYRNSKLISRTTLEGYWKPTGNARKIINSESGSEIGSKKTLVFYRGQCNNKNKNKTSWVMHEYELKATTDSDQDILDPNRSETSKDHDGAHNPCSAVEIYGGGRRSNQHNMVNEDEDSNISSNFINHVAEYTIMKVPLHLKELSTDQNEPKDDNRVRDPYNTIEQDDESCNSILTNYEETITKERSNQHNIVIAAEGYERPSSEISNQHNIVIAAEGFERPSSKISNQHNIVIAAEGIERPFNESSNQHNIVIAPEDFEMPSNESSNQHNIVIAVEGFEMPSNESSNQHNIVIAAEGFEWPSYLEYLAEEDIFPTEPLYNDGLYNILSSLYVLLEAPGPTNNSNWIQDQYIINKEHDQFLNSTFADTNQAYLQEGNMQQCLAADNEGFGLPCIRLMLESSNWMEKSRKRKEHVEYNEPSIETEAQHLPSNESSNEHNIVIAAKGFEGPSYLEYHVEEDIIPAELLYNDGLSNKLSPLDGLLEAPGATNNSNWIQDQYITNKEHGELLNSTFADKNEAYLQEGNMQQCLAAENEGFRLPCISSMPESSNWMEKSRKRKERFEYDESFIETVEAQHRGRIVIRKT
ncbi:NAC domain-containing protein 53-like isoform X2 [Hibiscus syriacus]|uniref:NAC domain-containing protein 53-like isoform X2 n=1 Tax=Hibiscus syriacus TaxID=106335 RepID=UPI0019216FBF|nr:NAC domain-containing protein 53-like isoform X2 [Hibiscus syriacus]